jgi:hypothetical protein
MRTFGWTIDKSVSPAVLELFRGDSGTAAYKIVVTKDDGIQRAWIDGTVCVTNGGAEPTENLKIQVVLERKSGSSWVAEGQYWLSLGSNPVLDPGEEGCYGYRFDLLSPVAGATYRVTANITITNHSGSLGTPSGPSPKASLVFPASPTLIHDSINVDDTNGASWAFSDDGSVSYAKVFTCDGDKGITNNTATIRETGQFDTAAVTVYCYALDVKKTAETSFTRTYRWAIDKFADQSSLSLALNQSFLVNYTVVANMAGYTDSDWAVAGKIWVKNPAPIAAMINSVADVVSGVGAVGCNCGVSFPYELAAGATLECGYSTALPNADSRTNTATATLQNTPRGTTDFSGTAAVSFAGAAMNEVDECITVDDTLGGTLGTVCQAGAPKRFTYSYNIGPYSTCGQYTVNNTAAFVTNDTKTSAADSWTVNVNVPCGGCTLTIGYWKTHAGFGPQKDMVTKLLLQWLGTEGGAKSVKVESAGQAVTILSTMGSNGIDKLKAQLLAAKLNIKNGASNAAVASTITAADEFLAATSSADWGSLSKTEQGKVLGLMSTLDKYNNGLIGPGHCSQ